MYTYIYMNCAEMLSASVSSFYLIFFNFSFLSANLTA